jgi:hypothetical protein
MKKQTMTLAAMAMAVGMLPAVRATAVEGSGAGDPAAALRAAVAQASLAATAVDGGREADGTKTAGGRLAQGAGDEQAAEASGLSGSISRRVLAGDVAEYSFQVRVGPGVHDVFGLHRVVREVAPFLPVHAGRGLMMAHGDAWGFDAAFLSGLASPSPAALPVFLAENGIDVWGIDFRWSLVGSTTTDFSFMKQWGMATDAGDLAVALATARLTRTLTGDGAAPLNLLGWSRGGQTSYVYVNAETRVPSQLRQVGGLIVVESFLRTDQADVQQAACARLAGEQMAISGGTFASTSGTLFATLGSLASAAPGGASPVISGLTNSQAAILAGAVTYSLLPPGQAFVPLYHFLAGVFNSQGQPTGLAHTPAGTWYSMLAGASPFEPEKVLADGDAAVCGQGTLPLGDHLADITLPVLYVGAGGGIGQYGVYTTTLLGSHDVTLQIVALDPPAQRAFDLGHVDPYTATDAQPLFWQPILTWLLTH